MLVPDAARSTRWLRSLADVLTASLTLTILAFAAIDLIVSRRFLGKGIAAPLFGYVLLSAAILSVAGWLGRQLIDFCARKLLNASPARARRRWLAVATAAAILAAGFAGLVTAGRGISTSRWKLIVQGAVVLSVTSGVLWLVGLGRRRFDRAEGRQPLTGALLLAASATAIAATTFHSTTYLRIHLVILFIASVLMQIGLAQLVVRRPLPVTAMRKPLPLRGAPLVVLLGMSFALSRQGATARSSLGLVVFSETLVAQKLTPLLFSLSPIQSPSQADRGAKELLGTRLARANAPPVKPLSPGQYAGAHVVWVSADALRPDYVGKLEQGGVSLTPELDRLRGQSTSFTEAIADYSHTSRSLLSVLSGRWDLGNASARDQASRLQTTYDRNRLPRWFRQKGYFTVANMMGGRWGENFFDKKSIPDFDLHVQPGPNCTKQVEHWEQFLDHRGDPAPLFLWMHLFDTHRDLPHTNPKARSDDGAREKYVAGVRRVDECVGRVIDSLVRKGYWDKTLFVFFADHGEALGEHGRVQRHSTCYLHDVRIPLMFKLPGQVAPQRISRRIQLSDLLPTVANLVGMTTADEGTEGDDMSGLFAAREPPVARGMAFSRGNVSQYPCASVINESWHLIYTDSGRFYELYDVDKDPAEVNNVVASEASVVERLRPMLDAYFAAGKRDIPASD